MLLARLNLFRSCACILGPLLLSLHHALAEDVSARSTTTIDTTVTSITTLATSTITVTVTLSRNSEAYATETSTTTSTGTSIGIMTSTSTAAASKATSHVPGSLEAVVLNSTNFYREQYHAEPLVWNETSADIATNWAKGCVWKHSGGPTGENLAAEFPNSTLAIDAWAAEQEKYNWKKAKFTHDTGHFTQLVWRNTTSVGCGLVACDSAASDGVKGDYLVCEYWPPGNYKDDFKNNVVKAGVDDDGSPSLGGAAGGCSSVKRAVVALVAASLVVAMFS